MQAAEAAAVEAKLQASLMEVTAAQRQEAVTALTQQVSDLQTQLRNQQPMDTAATTAEVAALQAALAAMKRQV